MARVGAWKMAGAVFVLCTATVIAAQAQTFKVVASFDAATGYEPGRMNLAQGVDGSLYGVASLGGTVNCNLSQGCGTAFKIDPTGKLINLHSFCSEPNCPDGELPYVGLVQASHGSLYGVTADGVPSGGQGTLYKIQPGGTLTTIYTFCARQDCADGRGPRGVLVPSEDGNLYGVTSNGGSGCPPNGCGTVFRITPSGTLTTLYNFCTEVNCPDGSGPLGLARGDDGNFYGTTVLGGDLDCPEFQSGGCGTAFKITPAGVLTTLHIFEVPDGNGPAQIVQGIDGNFYGNTSSGGAKASGTIFKMKPDGTLTVLYNAFCTQTSCQIPSGSPLLQATDGNIYGTTIFAGAPTCNGNQECGAVYKITPTGTLTVIHRFCPQPDCPDGSSPFGGLVQATNGNFYGATLAGGANNGGTIYRLLTGLGPFVKLVFAQGRVGQTGGILGQGFIGTTSVSLNGTAANFTVVSDTYIRATVPVGASTGYVTVTTPSGTLTSNKMFVVLP